MTLIGQATAQRRFAELHRLVPTAQLSPGGVGGDFDGDGDDDVLFGFSERAAGALVRNDGGRFVRVIGCAQAPSWFKHARAGDVDLDGDVDVLTETALHLNDGAGCFTEVSGGPRGRSIALGDIDGDGDLDAGTGFPSPWCDHSYAPCVPGYVLLWRNDSAAGWVNISAQLPVGIAEEPVGMVFGDFDGDSDLDWYISGGDGEDGWGTHKLLLNDGAGSFADASFQLPQLAQGSIHGSFSTYAADFDGDQDLDILVGTEQLYLNAGNAHFVDVSASLGELGDAAIGDVDGDGDIDVVCGAHVHLNNGSAHFVPVPFPVTGHVADGLLSDFDRDGDLDVFVMTQLTGELLFNDGSASFSSIAPRVPRISELVPAVAAGDLDGDHDTDMYGACDAQDQVFSNDGSGSFAAIAQPSADTSDFPRDVALADFDADGDLDALVVGGAFGAPSTRMFVNDGHASFAPQSLLNGNVYYAVDVADVDEDGDVDALLGNAWVNDELYLNDGAGNLTLAPAAFPPDWGSHQLRFVDFDADGDVDVLGRNSGWVRVFLNDGAGVFVWDAPVFSQLGQHSAFDVADLDGDGDLDAASGNNHQLKVAFSTAGLFTQSLTLSTPADGSSLVIADFDLDGDQDIVCGHPLDYFVNDGAGHFTSELGAIPWLGPIGRLDAADVDDDGDVDLIASPVLFGADRVVVLSNLTRQLAWRTPPRIGATMELALYGPADAEYLLLATHAQAYVPFGALGTLRVDRSALELRRNGRLDAQGRAIEPYSIANDPSLAGTSLYWQALIANPRRLTNLEITTFVLL